MTSGRLVLCNPRLKLSATFSASLLPSPLRKENQEKIVHVRCKTVRADVACPWSGDEKSLHAGANDEYAEPSGRTAVGRRISLADDAGRRRVRPDHDLRGARAGERPGLCGTARNLWRPAPRGP